jgi:lycopene cyclase domain-containing protein
MDMALYTLLNLLIILFPLLLSFDRRVAFWRRWPAAAAAIVVVGGVFVGWDAVVTRAGHWTFDPARAGAARILGLPPGELLFFAAAPYACLFILEVMRAYLPDAVIRWPRWAAAALGAGAAGAAVFFRGRGYTFLVLVLLGATLLLMAGPGYGLFRRRTTLAAFGLSYLPFLAFNGLFTGLPIVSYAPEMILGPRVLTIPVEDFAYSFCLVGLSFMAYELAERVFGRNAA